jgi:hypothetical protein
MKMEIDRYIDIDWYTRSFDNNSQSGLSHKLEFLSHEEVKEREKDVLYNDLKLKLKKLTDLTADDENKKKQEKQMERHINLHTALTSSINDKSEPYTAILESVKVIDYQPYNLDDPINQRHKYTIESSYLHLDKESQYDNEFDFFQGNSK